MWKKVTKEELEKKINIDRWMKCKSTVKESDGEHSEWYDKKYRIVASCYDGMIYQVRAE